MASNDTPEVIDAIDPEVIAELSGQEVPEPLQQTVEILDIGPCKKHVKVVVDRAAIDTRLREKIDELMVESPAQVPGFRPGKTPRKIIEKKFAKEVRNEVKNQVLMASLEQLADEKLSPLGSPELDPSKIEIPEEGPFIYEFDIEVRPEFEVPDYVDVKIRRPVHEVTDADVDKQLKKMLQKYGQVVPKDGPESSLMVEMNDILTVDLEIVHGETVLNTSKELQIRVESQLTLEDGIAEYFGAVLVGAKINDVCVVDIQLSHQLPNPDLRGQIVKGRFTILDIKVTRLPELTPEFLKNTFEVYNQDQLHEEIRVQLERYVTYQQQKECKQQVITYLASDTNFDLPQDLLQRQARKTLQRQFFQLKQAGMTDEQIIAQQRVLSNNAIQSTAAALKQQFILQKVAEMEKLEVEDDDIDMEIENIAERTDESPRKLRARLQREGMLESIAAEILEQKALQKILDHASYENYPKNLLEQESDQISNVNANASGETPTMD